MNFRVFCQSCGQSYQLDPAKIPPEGKKARCRTCAGVFVVAPPGTDLPMPGTKGPWGVRADDGTELSLDLAEIKNSIRHDGLLGHQEVLPPGAGQWMQAGTVPALHRYFQLKQQPQAAPAPAAAAPVAPAASRTVAGSSDRFVCANHPQVDAKHVCHACQTYYCARCVGQREVQTIRLAICPKCDEPTDDVVQPRVVKPFWTDLARIYSFPFHREGILTFIIFIVFFVLKDLVGFVSPWGKAILWLPLAGYLLNLIKESAQGVEHPPDFPDFGDFFGGLVLPAVKMFLASIIAFLPVIAWWLIAWQFLHIPGSIILLGALIGALLGLLYYPMILAILGVWGSLAPSFNPVLLLRLIGRIKMEYTIFLVFWYGTWLVFLVLAAIAKLFPFGFIPAGIAESYFAFVLFHMLGRMVYQTEDKLAWE